MEHDQSSYFCRCPDDFCWGPAPVGPTLVTGPTGAKDSFRGHIASDTLRKTLATAPPRQPIFSCGGPGPLIPAGAGAP